MALHACGIATDMVMEHCIDAGAAFIISPCCYGFIQNAVKFTFPKRFVPARVAPHYRVTSLESCQLKTLSDFLRLFYSNIVFWEFKCIFPAHSRFLFTTHSRSVSSHHHCSFICALLSSRDDLASHLIHIRAVQDQLL